MRSCLKLFAPAMFLALTMAMPSTAIAQPLNVVVNPLGIFAPPPPGAYDDAPAIAAATGYTADHWAIIRAPVLLQTGPYYTNPARFDRRRAIVLRRGSAVPSYVVTQRMQNISVPGLAPNASYSYFVAPARRVVILEPVSRRVVAILR